MHDPDSDLIQAFKAGDGQALETLYWRHADRVWRYGRYFTGCEELAAEIVQDTFVRIARTLAQFEGRARFTTYLFTVVRSVSITVNIKRRKAERNGDDEPLAHLADHADGPLDSLLREEACSLVRHAVRRLPENEREAILLCELQEFSIREAAAVLGWGESRVKVTLFRARRKLKDILAPRLQAMEDL
jgi:RNA polymerase sigma-70 factor (ECF subfamily)